MALPVVNVAWLWRLSRNAVLMVIASRVAMVLYAVGVVAGLASGVVYIVQQYAPYLNITQYFGDILAYVNGLESGYAQLIGNIIALDVGVELWDVGFKFFSACALGVVTVGVGYLSFRFYVSIRNAIVNDVIFKT